MKFTEFLVESAPRAWMMTNPDEIHRWLVKYDMYDANSHIAADGTVSAGGIYFSKNKLKFVNGGLVFPINFDTCDFFNAQNCRLSTLEGAPRVVKRQCYLTGNLLTDLDGIPEEVHGTIDFSDNPGIKTLEGIHKKLKLVGATIGIPNTIQSHILGLLMIKNVQKITCSSTKSTSVPPRLQKAVVMINKHLAGDRDVLACQEEMIEAGLKEFAKS